MTGFEISLLFLWGIVILLAAVTARLLSMFVGLQSQFNSVPDIDVGAIKRVLVFVGSTCDVCHQRLEQILELEGLGAEIVADQPNTLFANATVDLELFHRYRVPGTPYAVLIGTKATRKVALGTSEHYELLRQEMTGGDLVAEPTGETTHG